MSALAAGKPRLPGGPGTLAAHGPLFGILVLGVIVLVRAIKLVPGLGALAKQPMPA
jgi:K+-transporting ATPase A subunit